MNPAPPPKKVSPILFGLAGAFLLGGIGFAAGFFGPIIFTPEANQGPLLGIFITGPLGFIVGFGIGVVYALARNRKRNKGDK